jgi:hypothetical protein
LDSIGVEAGETCCKHAQQAQAHGGFTFVALSPASSGTRWTPSDVRRERHERGAGLTSPA